MIIKVSSGHLLTKDWVHMITWTKYTLSRQSRQRVKLQFQFRSENTILLRLKKLTE